MKFSGFLASGMPARFGPLGHAERTPVVPAEAGTSHPTILPIPVDSVCDIRPFHRCPRTAYAGCMTVVHTPPIDRVYISQPSYRQGLWLRRQTFENIGTLALESREAGRGHGNAPYWSARVPDEVTGSLVEQASECQNSGRVGTLDRGSQPVAAEAGVVFRDEVARLLRVPGGASVLPSVYNRPMQQKEVRLTSLAHLRGVEPVSSALRTSARS